jgi:cytochrome P450
MAITRGSSLAEDVEGLIACRADVLANRYSLYRRMRDESPIHRAHDRVLISRFADVSQVLLDPRMLKGPADVRSSQIRTSINSASAKQRDRIIAIHRYRERFLVASNGEHHTRLRAIVHEAFTPRAIDKLKGRIEEIAESLADALAGRDQIDLISEFAYHLPLIVVCEMLGIPPSDRARLRQWSSDIAEFQDKPELADATYVGIRALNEYLRSTYQSRRGGPTTALMESLLTALDAGDPDFTEDDLGPLLINLVVAGHETTTNLIANGVQALLSARQQWDTVCGNPSAIPNAVEELLRFCSPAQTTGRIAVDDLELRGVPVRRWDSVTVVLAAANHDPARFPNPEQLDVQRRDTRHVGFGLGPHFCLGAALNQMETAVALATLARRYPDMRLAASELEYRPNMTFMAFAALPVVLGHDRG